MKKVFIFGMMLCFITTICAKTIDYNYNEKIPLNKQSKIDFKQISDESSFTYTCFLGSLALLVPIPVPGIGIGHRERYDNFAIDLSVNLSSLILASRFDGNIKFLQYRKNNKYIGGGLAGSCAFLYTQPAIIGGYPFLTLGKDNKKNFHEFNFSIIGVNNLGIGFSPGFNYVFGIKF